MFLCPKKLLMGLLFMLLASSAAFQAVRSVAGGWIATAEGLPKIGGLFVHALVFMVLSTMIWRYVPFGSSNFGRKQSKRAERAARRAERYEDEDDGEEFNQPDPSKMHAGVYH